MDTLMLYRISQSFPDRHLHDIEQTMRDELRHVDSDIKPGMRIAITVGSRGIANLSRIVKALVEELKSRKAIPFIIPAMGSHGGATAEGQKEVLAGYGITEKDMGVPIQASMDVVSLPPGDLPLTLYQDRIAHEADGIILLNRIKVHTDFHGEYESGLMKMSVIGLGKHAQAKAIHQYGAPGLRDLVPRAARQIIKTSQIILGIGIVENAYDQTMLIKAIPAAEIEREEPKLLSICRQNMPRLPVDSIDALIVDRIGKDISGTGMDTNIIGRMRIRGEEEPAVPDINKLIVCDLSDSAYGNAAGMGLADFTTKKLQSKINFAATYENILTSIFTERGKMPIVAETDLQAFEHAVRTWGKTKIADAFVIRMLDTLHLDTLYVSQAVYQQVKDNSGIKLLDGPHPAFTPDGQLNPFRL